MEDNFARCGFDRELVFVERRLAPFRVKKVTTAVVRAQSAA
jgi:hypothetical protein